MFDIKPEQFAKLRVKVLEDTSEQHYQELVRKANCEFKQAFDKMSAGKDIPRVSIVVEIPGHGEDYEKNLAIRLAEDMRRHGYQAQMVYQEAIDDGPNRSSPSRVYVDVSFE